MIALIGKKREAVERLCAQYGVRNLALFGSAAGDLPADDLDFLVTFGPMSPAQHADAFFGLQSALEQLFGMPVDLVEPSAIRNPYFLESVERTKVVIYAAA